MNPITVKFIKGGVLIALIALALVFYSMGIESGFIILLVIGFALEAAFWLFGAKLFSRKKPMVENETSS